MTVGTLRIHNRDGRARSHYVYLALCARDDDPSLLVRVGVSSTPIDNLLRKVRPNAPVSPRFLAYVEVGTRSSAYLVCRAVKDSLEAWRMRDSWYVATVDDGPQFREHVKRALARFDTDVRVLTLQQIDVREYAAAVKERSREVRTRLKRPIVMKS